MLDRQPAQRFPRSSLIPSLPSARLSLRHSLSRKRRRTAKQLQPAVPLTPIPEVASREVTPTPHEATTTATSSSAYTSGFTSGVTSGFSTTATSSQTAGTSPTEPDDATASSPPISPLSPTGLEVTQSPSPPTSPAAWWHNLPYPSASTTPLPFLNAELMPWDPRSTSWRGSYIPVLKAWETYLARQLGGFSTGPSLSLSLQIPATPPPGKQEGQAEAGAAPRLPSPFSPVPSAQGPLLADEDIRWSSTGSPLPPAVPAKDDHHAFPSAPESGLEVVLPQQPSFPQTGSSRWPPPHPLPGTWPPSPTPSEPPSPRSPAGSPLSPFPSPPLPPPPPTTAPTAAPEHDLDLPEVFPTPPSHDRELPEVAPDQGGLHVSFAPLPSPSPSPPPRTGVRRSSSFPPTIPIPIDATAARARLYTPSSRSPSPMPSRDEKEGRGPVSAVRVKRGVWERVKARMMEKFPRGAKKPASGESGERGWDYETSPQEKGKGQGKGRLRRVWRALRGKGAGKGKGE